MSIPGRTMILYLMEKRKEFLFWLRSEIIWFDSHRKTIVYSDAAGMVLKFNSKDKQRDGSRDKWQTSVSFTHQRIHKYCSSVEIDQLSVWLITNFQHVSDNVFFPQIADKILLKTCYFGCNAGSISLGWSLRGLPSTTLSDWLQITSNCLSTLNNLNLQSD